MKKLDVHLSGTSLTPKRYTNCRAQGKYGSLTVIDLESNVDTIVAEYAPGSWRYYEYINIEDE